MVATKFNQKLFENFFVPPYAIILTIVGIQLRKVSDPVTKQIYCTLIGVLTYMACIGNMTDIYVIMSMKFVNSTIIRVIGPRKCHIYSLVTIFTIVTITRLMILQEIIKLSFIGDMIVLFLILKLVGFSFWINSEFIRRNNQQLLVNDIVSLYEEISYYFCYCGMLIGPCFSYQTYHDMIHMNKIKNEHDIPVIEYLPSLRNIINEDIIVLLWLAPTTLLVKYYSDQAYMTTNQFLYEDNIIKKIYLITQCSIILRYRLYIAFIMAKWTCKGIGLGAYPVKSKPNALTGPSISAEPTWKKVYSINDISFTTINNINVCNVEFGYIYGDLVRNWNITVQNWLAQYIYRGLSFSRRSVGRFTTFVVSALWHGLYPGYYLTFGTAITLLSLESRLVYYGTQHMKHINPWVANFGKFVCWFLLNRLIDYGVIGFIILSADDVIKIWKSVYFYGHVALITLTILACILIPIPKNITHRSNLNKPISVN